MISRATNEKNGLALVLALSFLSIDLSISGSVGHVPRPVLKISANKIVYFRRPI